MPDAFPNSGQAELVERARVIAADVVAPSADAWDADAAWPEAAVRALQRSGLAGLMVPEEHGGLGRGLSELLLVCEALGKADASTALCFGMHCVATACLAAKPTGHQATRFLDPIARGQHWTTLALSERGTGSHFYIPESTMLEDGDGYRLSGSKHFVTNGGHADSYVVSTAIGDDARPGHFSLVLLEADSAADRWGPPWDGWGMRANSSRSLDLDGVLVPEANRLGEVGDQLWYVFSVVAPYFLAAMAGTYLGLAARSVDEARGHLASRTYAHTGAPLAEIEILQHRLGTLWAAVESARRLCYWAAREADRGGPEAVPAICAAKAEVGRTAVHVANECLTLVGGTGYGKGSVLQRILRDARAAHVMSPTTDMLYTWTGRALLDLPLLGV